MRRFRVMVVAACALVAPALGACGGGDAAGDGRAASAPAAAGKALRVPDVQVTDVASGAKVSLRSQVATDRPTLLWAWAPY